MKQDQFLNILDCDEAVRRFDKALKPRPIGVEDVPLTTSLGRIVAGAVVAGIDVPPFDRSGMDGFAVRAEDVAGASETTPVVLRLNGETIACGVRPEMTVETGTATPIATGGPIPRGADAVMMIEHTEPGDGGTIQVRRPVASGQYIGFAGTDIARGEVVLRKGAAIGSREIGMLAACGIGHVPVFKRPRVAVISTGDELVPPGETLRPAGVYDTNGPIVAATVSENGGDPVVFPAVPDDEAKLDATLREALDSCDMIVLSGGTSKGAGDYTSRLVAKLGSPGIIAHGVALKPGKPLCLAVAKGKGVVVLPGFPTSAMFTFHEFVVPVLRRLAGLPPRDEARLEATVPVRVPSEIGRMEFVMAALGKDDGGALVAHPALKGSGAISSFAQADGFFAIDALSDAMAAGTKTEVTLFSPHLRIPDLVIAGSHCVGLEVVIDHLSETGFSARVLQLGSLGGLAAASRRECDLAPIHLFHVESGVYNRPYLSEGLELVEGWRRTQGIVFSKGDTRFQGRSIDEAIEAAVSDPTCIMVNRNQGAGTRILIDKLLRGRKPDGYMNQPRSHNAVAARVAQGLADWGMAIETVAHSYGLGFIPYGDEHYDFAVVASRRSRPALAGFIAALAEDSVRTRLKELGFRPA